METLQLKSSVLTLIALCLLTANFAVASDNWEMITSKSGITIYERWVKVNGELTVKERKGELKIKAERSQIVNLLCDPSKTALWMESVSESYLLGKADQQNWYTYTFFNLPWPMDNRDLVCITTITKNTAEVTEINIVSTEHYLPEKQDVKRLTDYKASWKIMDVGDGYVSVTLSAISYRSPEFPRFVLDPLVRGVFSRNLMNLKVILSQ